MFFITLKNIKEDKKIIAQFFKIPDFFCIVFPFVKISFPTIMKLQIFIIMTVIFYPPKYLTS